MPASPTSRRSPRTPSSRSAWWSSRFPTGVVADTVGRRASYLLGTLVLSAATVLYWLMWVWSAPFWLWARGVGAARARVHVLLRRGRGVARRCLAGERLQGRARAGLLQGDDRRRHRHARRLGARRCGRTAERPGRAVPGARGHPRAHARRRVLHDARHRLHARQIGGTDQGGAHGLPRFAEARARQSAGALPDARGALHGRRRDLRVLRAAAVSARAVGRPEGVLDRGPRGRGRGGLADRRRHPGAPRAQAVQEAHDGADHRGHHRRRCCCSRSGSPRTSGSRS